MQLKNYLNNW